jgi:hypothetical protein
LDANADVLNRFFRLFLSANGASAGENFALENGQVVGPIIGTDKILSEIPLFVGKIRTDLLAA